MLQGCRAAVLSGQAHCGVSALLGWAVLGTESGVQRRLLAAGGWTVPAPSLVLRRRTRPLCRLLPAPCCCSRADRASLCLPQRPPRSVWDVRSGGVVRSLESGGAVTSIEVTPCGRFLVTADGKQVGWAGQLPALPSRSGCVPVWACGGMHHGRVRTRRSRLHHPSAPFLPLCTHAHHPALQVDIRDAASFELLKSHACEGYAVESASYAPEKKRRATADACLAVLSVGAVHLCGSGRLRLGLPSYAPEQKMK